MYLSNLDCMQGLQKLWRHVYAINSHRAFLHDDECRRTVQVQITDFKERSVGKDLISACIFVEQESQKGIIVGRKGSALKALGTAARADIETFLGEQPRQEACHPSVPRLYSADFLQEGAKTSGMVLAGLMFGVGLRKKIAPTSLLAASYFWLLARFPDKQ